MKEYSVFILSSCLADVLVLPVLKNWCKHPQKLMISKPGLNVNQPAER